MSLCIIIGDEIIKEKVSKTKGGPSPPMESAPCQ